jgi:hypothetical protein
MQFFILHSSEFGAQIQKDLEIFRVLHRSRTKHKNESNDWNLILRTKLQRGICICNIKKKYVKNGGDFQWLVSYHRLIIAQFIIEFPLLAKITYSQICSGKKKQWRIW